MLKKVFVFLLGTFFALILLECSLRIVGLIYSYNKQARNSPHFSSQNRCTILCLGESTTALGEEYSYPSQLEKILNNANLGIQFKVINEGIPGINTAVILANLRSNLDKYKPNIVVTMMGANDGVPNLSYKDSIFGKIPALNDIRLLKLISYTYRYIWYSSVESYLEFTDSSPSAYFKLANRYIDAGKYIDAKRILKNLIVKYPDNPLGYKKLAFIYRTGHDYLDAITILKNAIDRGCAKTDIYMDLGQIYYDLGMLSKAKEIFERALVLEPLNALVYVDLGKTMYSMGRHKDAEILFGRAITLGAKESRVYLGIAAFFYNRLIFNKAIKNESRYADIEGLLKKSIEIMPSRIGAYFLLGSYYYRIGRYTEAKQMYDTMSHYVQDDDYAFGVLGKFYKDIGDHKSADSYKIRGKSLRLENYNLETRNSYLELENILAKRNVYSVVVQYPLRPVQQLKNMLGDLGNGVVFVDNEQIFKDVLRKVKYEDIFIDTLGGDFGHCTPEGNRILAGNIARVIINEWFKADKK